MQELDGADVSPVQDDPWDNRLVEAEAEDEVEVSEESEQENEAGSPPADEENVEEKTPQKDSDPVQERIDKLTRNWRETQRALAEREEELTKLQSQLSSIPEGEDKTLADFDYDEAKYRAYTLDQARKTAEKAATDAISKYQQEQQQKSIRQEYQRREQEFSKSVKDYTETVYSADLRISAPMAEAIRVLDDGPEIAYWLGKHPDIAADIADMPAVMVGAKLAGISSEIKASKSNPGGSKAPPPPPKKISGKEAGQSVSPDDPASDELSDDAWFKAEAKRQAKLRGK